MIGDKNFEFNGYRFSVVLDGKWQIGCFPGIKRMTQQELEKYAEAVNEFLSLLRDMNKEDKLRG